MALSLSDAHGIRWGLVGAIVCLMLALAVAFWPESELAPTASVSSPIDSEKRIDASVPSTVPVPAVGPPQSGAETVAGAVSVAEPHAVVPIVASAISQSSSAAITGALPVSSASAPPNSQAVQTLSSNSAGDAALQFTAAAASWIRVTDGNGAVIWEKTVLPGTVEAVPGKAPLTVVIGRADVTRVILNGKPYDLTNATKDNVARFEVRK